MTRLFSIRLEVWSCQLRALTQKRKPTRSPESRPYRQKKTRQVAGPSPTGRSLSYSTTHRCWGFVLRLRKHWAKTLRAHHSFGSRLMADKKRPGTRPGQVQQGGCRVITPTRARGTFCNLVCRMTCVSPINSATVWRGRYLFAHFIRKPRDSFRNTLRRPICSRRFR